MLDGRLELHATEERTGRKLMGHGLGLEVLDLRTETLRQASTRSGGETVRAALALALGLADTGRANAGGIEICMLVIDEGFGSLDPDRLDDVMAELQRLRKEAGRRRDLARVRGEARHCRADRRPADLAARRQRAQGHLAGVIHRAGRIVA